jgi:hypothetical protein
MDVIIWPLMYGFPISILALLVYFGLLAKQRRNGVLVLSELVILALAVITLISTYIVVDLYLISLHYFPEPPPYSSEQWRTSFSEMIFWWSYMPMLATTILLVLAYFGQRLRMANRVQG